MERPISPTVRRAAIVGGLLALSLALVSGARAGSLAGSLGWYDDQNEPRRCDELTAANPGLSNPDGSGEPCSYDAREDQQEGYGNLPVCQDGVDNDSDELTDCSDPDCFGSVGCGQGEWCNVESAQNAGQDGDCGGDNGDQNCQDGVDNDSDGLFDCADPDCAYALGTWSQVCEPHGDPVCPEYTCNAGNIGQDEWQCGGNCASDKCQNGNDDDGNGSVDCADESCAYQDVCQTQPENDEQKCSDGQDNDRDGSYDCSDSDCSGTSACWWAWSGWNPGNWSSSETDCGNGVDDDSDGYYDCSDSECSSDYRCSPVTNPVTTETAPWGWFDYSFCQNGGDDDYDGMYDCSDSDCQDAPACAARPCAVTEQDSDGNCQADNPYWGSSCGDGYDNDSDGSPDCSDSDCAGDEACSSGGGSGPGNFSEIMPDGYPVNWYYGNGYCVDGIDNDASGLMDCWDSACENQDPACYTFTGVGTEGWPYDSRFPNGNPRGGDVCVAVMEDCGNGQDDDCDGLVDFADEDCGGDPLCENESSGNVGGVGGCDQNAPAQCADGSDNDGDGRYDCDDEDCAWADVCQRGCDAEESCNGSDDDCDGMVDEGDVCRTACEDAEAKKLETDAYYVDRFETYIRDLRTKRIRGSVFDTLVEQLEIAYSQEPAVILAGECSPSDPAFFYPWER
jgi:hypothetical protein